MRCLVISDGSSETAHPLPSISATIGSDSDNDICLRARGVSRSHAVLLNDEDEGFVLRDLGSRNGIIVGEEKVSEVVLREGTSVRLGRATLSIADRSTSNVILGVAIEHSPRKKPLQTEEDPPRREQTSPARAIGLIRQIESAAHTRRAIEDLESEIMGLLEIRGMFLTTGSDASEASLLFSIGEIPDDEHLERLDIELASRGANRITLSSIAGSSFLTTTIRTKKKTTTLVAWKRAGSTLWEWQADLFSYLASSLTGRPKAARQHGGQTPRSGLDLPEGIVRGSSPVISALYRELESTIASDLDVLVWGETGVGKEHVARLIHLSGPTSEGPFLAINCAAIPRDLLEAELFGVRKHVATGVEPRKGLFLEAQGGTLFLDEISELEGRLQAKLLRAMQEREVLPIGATRPEKFDVRVISSSNRDLRQLIEKGAFRADLYYRLRGLTFHVPSLRDRIEDLPQLALHFAREAARRNDRHITGITRRALSLLRSHSWPGNIRELKLEIERAVLVARDGGSIGAEHFDTSHWNARPLAATGRDDATPAGHRVAPPGTGDDFGRPLQERIDELERKSILEALARARGNKSAAARLLGISRNGLTDKIKRLGLDS